MAINFSGKVNLSGDMVVKRIPTPPTITIDTTVITDLTVVITVTAINADSTSIDWGDGTINDLREHTYAVAGDYTITASATNTGGTVTDTEEVTVTAPVQNTHARLEFIRDRDGSNAGYITYPLTVFDGWTSGFLDVDNTEIEDLDITVQGDPAAPIRFTTVDTLNSLTFDRSTGVPLVFGATGSTASEGAESLLLSNTTAQYGFFTPVEDKGSWTYTEFTP